MKKHLKYFFIFFSGSIIGFLIGIGRYSSVHSWKADWFSAFGDWFSGIIAAIVLCYALLNDTKEKRINKKIIEFKNSNLNKNIKSLELMMSRIEEINEKFERISDDDEEDEITRMNKWKYLVFSDLDDILGASIIYSFDNDDFRKSVEQMNLFELKVQKYIDTGKISYQSYMELVSEYLKRSLDIYNSIWKEIMEQKNRIELNEALR